MNIFKDFKGYELLEMTSEVKHKKMYRAIKEEAYKVYDFLRKEFDVPHFLELEVHLFRNRQRKNLATMEDINISSGWCLCIPAIGMNMVGFSIAHSYLLEEDMFEQTIPHEIAHSFIDQMYPKLDVAHGKEWQEMMEYLKLPADIFYNTTPDLDKELRLFENNLGY